MGCTLTLTLTWPLTLTGPCHRHVKKKEKKRKNGPRCSTCRSCARSSQRGAKVNHALTAAVSRVLDPRTMVWWRRIFIIDPPCSFLAGTFFFLFCFFHPAIHNAILAYTVGSRPKKPRVKWTGAKKDACGNCWRAGVLACWSAGALVSKDSSHWGSCAALTGVFGGDVHTESFDSVLHAGDFFYGDEHTA